MKQITHGSTFSGIGAPEIAAEMLGWKNEFHCEINPFGRQILDYYFPNSKSYEDITKTDFSEWKGKITVLTGGFPCQPFSYAGKRRGAEDDRFLWPYMLKCIEQVRPTWFIGENVAGITTMAFPSEDVEVGNQTDLFGEGDTIYERREKFVLAEIIENLERIGYDAQPIIIPAVSVGAPHRRDRVFIIARRNDSTNTEHNGLEHTIDRGTNRKEDGKKNNGRENGTSKFIESASTNGRGRIASNTKCNNVEGYNINGINSEDGRRTSRNTTEKNCTNSDADTNSELLGTRNNCRIEEWQAKNRIKPYDCKGECGRIEDAWCEFPSVEPAVRRGDDGFSTLMDSLTIPQTKWRKESLKAYGNAIVPQVMYEIFRAIDIIEKQENNE